MSPATAPAARYNGMVIRRELTYEEIARINAIEVAEGIVTLKNAEYDASRWGPEAVKGWPGMPADDTPYYAPGDKKQEVQRVREKELHFVGSKAWPEGVVVGMTRLYQRKHAGVMQADEDRQRIDSIRDILHHEYARLNSLSKGNFVPTAAQRDKHERYMENLRAGATVAAANQPQAMADAMERGIERGMRAALGASAPAAPTVSDPSAPCAACGQSGAPMAGLHPCRACGRPMTPEFEPSDRIQTKDAAPAAPEKAPRAAPPKPAKAPKGGGAPAAPKGTPAPTSSDATRQEPLSAKEQAIAETTKAPPPPSADVLEDEEVAPAPAP